MNGDIRYLNTQQVMFIHANMIERHGGAGGILNQTGLESAVARPRQFAFGRELYEGLTRKAAALMESLARNHPFIDGNKRTAYASTGLFLRMNGLALDAKADDAEAFVLRVVAGELELDEIERWMDSHVTRASSGGVFNDLG